MSSFVSTVSTRVDVIAEEDRMLLEEETPVFSEDYQTRTVSPYAVVDLAHEESESDVDSDCVEITAAELEVSGIFKSPDASPVTKQESSV